LPSQSGHPAPWLPGAQKNLLKEKMFISLLTWLKVIIGVVVNCLVGSTLQTFSHLVQWIVEYQKKSANLYYSNIA
jgi:hypothetical protein